MKVILLEDVYKQGVAGEMVDVAPGFARNYLIPRKLAVQATPGAVRQFQNLTKKSEARRAERYHEYTQVAESVEALILTFPVRAGETGKLYGSITSADIAERLNQELGLNLDRRRVGDHPIRDLGSFSVPVRLDAGVSAHVRVIVHREGEAPMTTPAQAEAEEEVPAYYEETEEYTDTGEAEGEAGDEA